MQNSLSPNEATVSLLNLYPLSREGKGDEETIDQSISFHRPFLNTDFEKDSNFITIKGLIPG